MFTHSSHQINSTTDSALKSILNKIGFASRKQKAAEHRAAYLASLRAKRDNLDKEAMSLIGDNDAYYKNRIESWRLTEIIIKEVQ